MKNMFDKFAIIFGFDNSGFQLEYLWHKLGLEKGNIVYAGDSGNDLLAFVSGFNAVIVANTADAVKQEARLQAQRKNITQHLFFATGKYAAGVIDGCYHFNIFQ